MNADFVRDGRVGDEVWHPIYGNGVIIEIDESNNFPVKVKFKHAVESFAEDGTWCIGEPPTLCWGHREPLDQGQPPERSPEPFGFSGKPEWAWVGDRESDWKRRSKRRVIARRNGGFLVCGPDETEMCATEIYWVDYAWEIEDD